MSNKIFVTGLPRSRTAWFAEYFDCLHEGFMGCWEMDQYFEKLDQSNGDCNTTLYFKWDEIAERYNNPPLLIIMRNSHDVEESLARFNIDFDSSLAIKHIHNLIRTYDNTMLVSFDEINDSLPKICQFFGIPHDPSKDSLIDKRITCDIERFKSQAVIENMAALLGD